MHTILPHTENPVLREMACEVPSGEIPSPRIRALIADMKKLLAKEKFGVALAAPQVGEALRIFVVSGKALARDQAESETADATYVDQIYINPVMTKLSRGKSDKHEGCLSIRGKWGEVPRTEKATVRALDEHGRPFTRGASGFLAHIFQHEMDHLAGVLYIDKATNVYDEKDNDAAQ